MVDADRDRAAGGALTDHSTTGHPRRWTILAVLCAALCVVVLDNTILSVAIPSVGDALRSDETELQWITTAYGLILAALLLPLAGLGDRFGRQGAPAHRRGRVRPLVTRHRGAVSSGQLIVGRGLMGIGGAATMPATLAVLGNVFPAHERGRPSPCGRGRRASPAPPGPS